MLFLMNLLGKAVGIVSRLYSDGFLCDDRAAIQFFGDEVHGNTVLLFSGIENPPPLTAVSDSSSMTSGATQAPRRL